MVTKARKRQRIERSLTTGVQKPVGLLCRALAANSEERDLFLKIGYEENEIYTIGQGAENFEECLWSFRGRPGDLGLISDLRIFGNSRAAILAVMQDLYDRGITVRQYLPDSQITNPNILIENAIKAVSANRFAIRGRAKRVGKKGGASKGFHEKARRDARIAEDIVRALVIRDGIRKTAALLGKPFSRGVLTRHYQ